MLVGLAMMGKMMNKAEREGGEFVRFCGVVNRLPSLPPPRTNPSIIHHDDTTQVQRSDAQWFSRIQRIAQRFQWSPASLEEDLALRTSWQ